MQENILNEILISVKQTNEKVDVLAITLRKELREEFSQMLKQQAQELREGFNQMLKQEIQNLREEFNQNLVNTKEDIIKELASDIGKQFNDVMIVINRVEDQRHKQISNELKEHQEKAVKGVELLKETLVS